MMLAAVSSLKTLPVCVPTTSTAFDLARILLCYSELYI